MVLYRLHILRFGGGGGGRTVHSVLFQFYVLSYHLHILTKRGVGGGGSSFSVLFQLHLVSYHSHMLTRGLVGHRSLSNSGNGIWIDFLFHFSHSFKRSVL